MHTFINMTQLTRAYFSVKRICFFYHKIVIWTTSDSSLWIPLFLSYLCVYFYFIFLLWVGQILLVPMYCACYGLHKIFWFPIYCWMLLKWSCELWSVCHYLSYITLMVAYICWKQDNFLPRTATPLEDIFTSLFW